MLTNDDLKKIGTLVDTKLNNQLKPLQSDLNSLKSEMKTVKRDVTKIRGTVGDIVSLFDKEYLDLRKRVEILEEHLGLSTN